MSTNLNDVVFDVYRELTAQAQAKRVTKMQKFSKAPMQILPWLKWHIKALMCEYGRKSYSVLTRQGVPNVFTPTDKTFPEVKIAVYTVITGGYDDPNLPVYIDDSIDYYLFTDSDNASSKNWPANFRVLTVPETLNGLSSVKKNRYMKMHPDEVLSEEVTGRKYDYTIYIDGSLRITCDIKPLVYSLIASGKSIAIHNHFMRDCLYDEGQLLWIFDKLKYKPMKEQLDFYRNEGMPRHFGLPENTVLIRKTNDSRLQDIMHQWWLQVEKFTHRDQLSLPYVLWKNGLDMSYIFSLGNNVWKNPYFIYHWHKSYFWGNNL